MACLTFKSHILRRWDSRLGYVHRDLILSFYCRQIVDSPRHDTGHPGLTLKHHDSFVSDVAPSAAAGLASSHRPSFRPVPRVVAKDCSP